MEETRQSVIHCLHKFFDDDDQIIKEINRLAKETEGEIFSVALHILTNLEFQEQEAKECWQNIIAHREILSNSIGRKIGLRTAVCDYFCFVNRSLKNPKVVEIHIFEETTRSSKYDSLTKLVNRKYLNEALSSELARAKRHNTVLSILFFDLDNFKVLNDTFGHAAGDVALYNVAQIILSVKRTEDTAARYGGEEMVVILPETEKFKALILAERIRKSVEELKLKHGGQNYHLTLSGGISSYPNDAQTPETLLDCADKALYRAKAAGKNNIALYSKDKRYFIRVDFAGETFVQKLDNASPSDFLTDGKNLSLKGILFESDIRFEFGNKLQIKLQIDQNSEPLLLVGNVVRVEALNNSRYDIGVSFLEMDKTAKNDISGYITRYLENLPD